MRKIVSLIIFLIIIVFITLKSNFTKEKRIYEMYVDIYNYRNYRGK